MTGIAANNLSVRRNGATLLDGLSLSLGPTGSVAIIGRLLPQLSSTNPSIGRQGPESRRTDDGEEHGIEEAR